MTMTTHYLFPGTVKLALCGQDPGPIDLGPYDGRVSCPHCRAIGINGAHKKIIYGSRASFFSAAGETRLRP